MARNIKKILLLVIKLLISSSLLYFVLSKAGVEKVFTTIKNIQPIAFVIAILIYFVSIYISTMRWRLLLPEEFRTKRLFSYYLIGAFFNTFLPGLVGGDAVKTYYLYKETNKGSLSLASVFMDRYIGFVSLMIIGLVAFIAGFRYVKGSIIEWLLPVIILTFLLSSLIIFGLRLGKGIRILSELYKYFYAYKNQKIIIAKALLLSAIIQTMSITAIYSIAVGLRLSISISYFFIFFPIIATISSLPISISGIGVREGAFVLLFGLVGISSDTATALSFAWFLSVSVGGLAGLFEYIRLKR